MKLSAGPGKDGAKGMRRIILIKDKTTMTSWGFAFVEFVDIQVCYFFYLRQAWLLTAVSVSVRCLGFHDVGSATPERVPYL